MAGITKLTEKETVNLKETASFVITQPETVDGEEKEAVRRVPLPQVKRNLTNNLAPSVVREATGNIITLNDSGNMPLQSLSLYGKSMQQKTSGYQLFDASKLPTTTKNGITVTNNGDGSFILSGGSNVAINFNVILYSLTYEEFLEVFKTGTITLKVESVTNPYVKIQFYRDSGSVYLDSSVKAENSIVITDDILNDESVHVNILFYYDSTLPIKTGNVKPMLYQDGDGTWEPFTGGKPSPNQEYPQEIESVENPKVSIFGKNLVNIPDINLDGVFGYGEFIIKLKMPGGLFVLDNDVTKYPNDSVNNTRTNIQIYTKDSSNMYKQGFSSFDTTNAESDGIKRHKRAEVNIDKSKLVVKQNCLLLDYSQTSMVRYAKSENNMLSINPIDDKFYPYIPEQSVTFPYTLRGIPVTSGGNYTDADGQQWICDTIEVNADGSGKLVQRCVEININTVSDVYDVANPYGGGFYIRDVLPEKMNKRAGFSNSHIINTGAPANTDFNVIWIGVNTTSVYILNSDFYDNTLEDKGLANFKAFLAENPLKIVTYANTSTEIELTTEEIQAFQALHTNKPYTTIFNNQNGDMAIEYVADTKLYIDNKFAELQNAILSTGGNV